MKDSARLTAAKAVTMALIVDLEVRLMATKMQRDPVKRRAAQEVVYADIDRLESLFDKHRIGDER